METAIDELARLEGSSRSKHLAKHSYINEFMSSISKITAFSETANDTSLVPYLTSSSKDKSSSALPSSEASIESSSDESEGLKSVDTSDCISPSASTEVVL